MVFHKEYAGHHGLSFDAHIEAVPQENMLNVKNVLTNNSLHYSDFIYKFKCKKTGKSGTSISSQAGKIKAAPGQTVELSKTIMAIAGSDNFELHLLVYNDMQEVVEDAIIYPGLQT